MPPLRILMLIEWIPHQDVAKYAVAASPAASSSQTAGLIQRFRPAMSALPAGARRSAQECTATPARTAALRDPCAADAAHTASADSSGGRLRPPLAAILRRSSLRTSGRG